MKIFRPLALLCLLAAPMQAQTNGYAALKADQITYTSGYQVLRASGHVEITYGTILLTATELVFDAHNDLIDVKGPLRLQDGDAVTIVAEYAQLSGDMRRGILQSARMVLNKQLQISAVEISRDNDKTELFKAAASSCTVTLAHPTPFWQIRAKRIVHDQKTKQLHFENAQLRVMKVPIAYIPRLSLPDPSVRRSSGFLVPGISGSSLLGTGISVPYFLTLGDYADVTLTPYLYTSGTLSLGYDFRKRFHNGSLDVEGRFSRDSQTNTAPRAYLFANGTWKSKSGFHTALQLKLASDTSYISNHGISDETRLESYLRLSKTTRRSHFGIGVQGFRTLSSTLPPDDIPFLLGEVSLRQRFSPNMLGGQAGLSLAINSFNRSSTTNISGRDGVRVSSALDWQRNWFLPSGLVFSTTSELHADYYNIRQDATYPTPITRVTPIMAAGIRLPLSRQTAHATVVIEPRLQLVWSNTSGGAVPDDDSTQVEFDAANLFALNRFSGIDRMENGLRANIGLTYSRRNDKGLNIGAVIGKVVRMQNLGQFLPTTGLSGKSSSYVLAAQVRLPTKMRMVQRMVFDDQFNISKNETRIGYQNGKFDIDTSYLWLSTGAAGNAISRSEWQVDAGWNIGEHWRSQANWRYDLQAATASNAEFGLTYSNACIKVDFSLSRQFVSSSNVTASTGFALQVTLEGFGARANSDAYARKCSDF